MRNLILSCVLALFILVGWFILVIPVGAATTITVTTTGDILSDDGLCSLREAIIAANTDTESGSQPGECSAGSGADTINFSPGLSPVSFVLTRTGANEDAASTGDLDIIGTLTIDGDGVDNTILDGNNADRIFEIRPAARVTMTGLKIQNGYPGSFANGGGILIDGTGRLYLSHSSVTSNHGTSGGGIKVLGLLDLSDSMVANNQGGGVSNLEGLLFFSNVQVISNTAGFGIDNQSGATIIFDGGEVSYNLGGGIYNYLSTATLSNLSIISNTIGGGVQNEGSTTSRLTLTNSSILSNTGTSGAGILNNGIGTVANIDNTRISFNTATAGGGGINNSGSLTLKGSTLDHNHARSGGAIDHIGYSLQLTNDTLSSNTVSDNGGGLYNRSSATLKNITITGNSASGTDTGGNIFNDGDSAQLTIQNSIVSDAGSGGNCFNEFGTITSLGFNLESTNTCEFNVTSDITDTNPMLGPLQDNGGPTYTHALLEGSPAIDNGDDNACPASDQRGLSRPQGLACDIGAFEYLPGAFADLAIAKSASSNSVIVGDPLTYTLSVSNNGPDTATSLLVEDTLPNGIVYQDALGTGWSCNYTAGLVGCTRSSLGAGQLGTITILVDAPQSPGIITNSADVSSVTIDLNSNNNTADVNTTVVQTAPDLVISKDDGGVVPPPGEMITYTLSFTNVGTSPATNVVITDTLPENTTFNPDASSPGWGQVGTTDVYTYLVGGLSIEASGVISYAVSVDSQLPVGVTRITNTANIGDDGTHGVDLNPLDNTATIETWIFLQIQRIFLPLMMDSP